MGKKSGGRDFKPGQSGNPNGRPLLPGEIKELRKLNTATVTKIIGRYLNATLAELKFYFENPETPALDLAFIQILIKSGESGDQTRLNFLLDRTIGKVSEKIEHKLPQPTVIKLIGEDAIIAMGSYKNEDDEEDENA